ncbi:MAG: DUF6089 family protein [Bacteroidota bacterium]
MKKIVLILIIGLASFGLNAQKTMEVGLFGGGSYYIGDLNPAYHFLMSKPAYGLVARLNLDSRWTVKLSAYSGEVAGDDNISGVVNHRELFFNSEITDISAVLELNFFNYITGSTRHFLTPYIFGGIGMFMFKPEANGVSLRELGTEGQNIGFDGRTPYETTQLAIPFGLGFKYSLTKRLGFAFEWGLRKTFTDYIDDVSTTYYLFGKTIDPADAGEILSDPTMTHKAYQGRGNSKTNDWYAFFGVSITYKFRLGGNKRCTDAGVREDY